MKMNLVYALFVLKAIKKSEKIIDNVLGFVFDAPFGMPDLANGLKNIDKAYYLVNKNSKQFFVVVTNEFIESREIAEPFTTKKFEIGNLKFSKSGLLAKSEN